MEGIYFYWFFWISWIFTTFLMKKNKERFMLSFFILITIIGSAITFELATFTVRSSIVLLLLFCFAFIAKSNHLKLYYYIISSLIISIGYACFHLFELFDPIWLIFDRKWMLSMIILYLVLMLVKGIYDRIAIAIIGGCNGEILYSYILKEFSFPVEIGDFQFLDVVAISVFLLVLLSAFEKLAHYFEANFQKGKAGVHE